MRLLIVDDSIVFRHIVEAALAGEPDVEIVGTARNGRKALEALARCRPDLMTLDLEMPELDGISTLTEIEKLNAPLPPNERVGVIVLSSHSRAGAAVTMRALELGAFDFVSKPEGSSEAESIARLKNLLLPRIRAFAVTRASRSTSTRAAPIVAPLSLRAPAPARPSAPAPRERPGPEVICIGISTGGPRALAEMLPALCAITALPVVIVQHMPPNFTATFAEGLTLRCKRRVTEAQDGEVVEASRVYIAPGGRHVALARSAPGQLSLRVHDQAPENGCKPSVDVLFRSAAQVCHGDVVAVVMTGMGRDGEQGVRALKREGARIIAQDEKSSVVWGMPGAAVSTGCVDEVVALSQIAQTIRRAAGGR